MSKTFVCLVDNYRRSSRQRNTKGRYLVGAKNEKQAKDLLQKTIGFGSVQVYYEVETESGTDKFVNDGQVLKVTTNGYMEPRKATDPMEV